MEKDENQLEKFKELLNKFNKFLPKPMYEPTYLELCEYPWNRLEEICSRIFAFFFDSRNPHGFRTLFFNSLFDAYREKYPVEVENFDKKNIMHTRSVCAETEIYTEKGNRIDLLLTTDCLKVCIENKIDAPAYNDFNDYYDYVKNESECYDLHTVCILFALCQKAEYENVNPNFKTIYYREFLEKLKQNLGNYLTQCNSKYLPVLTDFILFLDRKGGLMSDFNEKEKDFFLNDENDRIIEQLIERRNLFLEKQRVENNQHIDKIKNLLSLKENATFCEFMKKEIWINPRDKRRYFYLKGCFEENNPKYALGIEAGFNKKKFDISLSVWQGDGDRAREALYKKLIDGKIDVIKTTHDLSQNEKWSIIVQSIDENDDKQIVDGLYDVYKKTEKIVNEAKVENKANEAM